MLPAGTVSDLLGRKKVMLVGVGVFCAGSVLGALAPNIDVLWAARGIMGLGAAASEPGTLSMIRHLFTDRRDRAQALGVWAAVSGLALAAGPVIGGALVGVWSWRAVFWFNLFFGLVALVGAALVLPENSDPQVGHHFDFLGFVLGAGALSSLTFATIAGETAGYRAWWVMILFAIGGIGLVLFAVVERRATNPILNVHYFLRPAFSGSTFVAFATYFGVFSIFFFVALYLEVVGSQSGYQIALDFIPMAGSMVIVSAFTGRWVAEMGPWIPMTFGCLLGTLGIVLTAVYLTPDSGISTLGWTLPLARDRLRRGGRPGDLDGSCVIPPAHSGMAASTTNTSRESGAVGGVAILGSIVNGQLTVQLAKRLSHLCLVKSKGVCILKASVYKTLIITAVTTGTISASGSERRAGRPGTESRRRQGDTSGLPGVLPRPRLVARDRGRLDARLGRARGDADPRHDEGPRRARPVPRRRGCRPRGAHRYGTAAWRPARRHQLSRRRPGFPGWPGWPGFSPP